MDILNIVKMLTYIFLFVQFKIAFIFAFNNCGCNLNRESTETLGIDSYIGLRRETEDLTQCPALDFNKYHSSKLNERNENMILVPADKYQLGTDDIVLEADREGPKRLVGLNSFYLDKYEVSNFDFSVFVESTGYKTDAEMFGNSFVFLLFLNDTYREKLKDFRVLQAPWWFQVQGADWRHPNGLDSNISDILDHPVTHVSWRDAHAFCKWRKSRLPTEAEWEAACRGGHQDTKYPWGDKLFPGRKHMANLWQGNFPYYNSMKDNYIGTNPVTLFPQNYFGFHNLAGNVWEWTADSWTSVKPNEKVKKGGSYLCHKSYCYRYRCSARSQNTEDSSAGNLGFRCARNT